jgi:hypothetical protein
VRRRGQSVQENDLELLARFGAEGVDIDKLGRLLQEQGVTSFAAAWQSLLTRIRETVVTPVAR